MASNWATASTARRCANTRQAMAWGATGTSRISACWRIAAPGRAVARCPTWSDAAASPMAGFASPISNRRNDSYGGDLTGRMKFSLEVLRAIRAVLPKDYPLGARISAVDWVDGGLSEDDAVRWVSAMKESGLDFVDVSSGGVTADVRTPTTPGYNVPIAAQIQRETRVATSVVRLIAT